MVINNVSGYEIQKGAAGTNKTDSIRDKTIGSAEKTDSDKVSVSAKAKLLHTLRKEFDKVNVRRQSIKELREKTKEGIHTLSSEEIVKEILRGTIFEVA